VAFSLVVAVVNAWVLLVEVVRCHRRTGGSIRVPGWL
jgi:hypothetical protein